MLVNTTRVSNNLDLDQDRRSVGPDLAPNCLQSNQQKIPLARKEIKKQQNLEISSALNFSWRFHDRVVTLSAGTRS